MNRLLHAVLAFLLVAAVGCTTDDGTASGSASPSGADPALSAPAGTEEEVMVQDQAFSPDELTVTVGTTVTWVNGDAMGHTITHGEGGAPLQDALFDEELSQDQVVSYTFEEPGTYPVTCRVHKDMQMTVIVEEG
jgi:plastocyanin